MLSAWLLVCTLQGAAPFQARSNGATLEMDLPANAMQMGGAFTRRRGVQQVVWIPGLQGVSDRDTVVHEGPVRRVQVKQKKLGVVLVLTPHVGAVLHAQTTLLGAPHAMLRVGPAAAAGSSEAVALQGAPAHQKASPQGALALHGAAAQQAASPQETDATAQQAASPQDAEALRGAPAQHAMPTRDGTALAWAQSGAPSQPSQHETAWNTQRTGWPQESGLAMHPLTWVAWGIGCAALLALAWVLRRRTPLSEHGGINIVAVRALGPRHKLALVTAGGERMLLATSDKEVVLLSHLGPTDNIDLEAVEPPKAFNLESVAARKPAPTNMNMGPLHTPDVLGLLRLRRAGAAA